MCVAFICVWFYQKYKYFLFNNDNATPINYQVVSFSLPKSPWATFNISSSHNNECEERNVIFQSIFHCDNNLRLNRARSNLFKRCTTTYNFGSVITNHFQLSWNCRPATTSIQITIILRYTTVRYFDEIRGICLLQR